jgi:hypothetical protein
MCIFLKMIVVVLLVAGCTGQQAMKTPANLTTATVTATSIDTTKASMSPVGTACPITENRSSWIRIDPMGSIEKGDTVRISGTTNLPAGKTLELSVYDAEYHPHCRCCFDDQLVADVRIRKGDSCGNTFSLWFDSTNYAPQEYLIAATYTENSSVTAPPLIINLLENTTPLSFPDKDLGNTGSANSSFALFPVGDIPEGEMETLNGIRNGTSYAVEYSIRDARTDAVCSPYCRDEIIHGVLYPAMFGPDATRFAIRFDTTDLEPGPYVADLDLTCSDSKARGWFNVTPVKAGIP